MTATRQAAAPTGRKKIAQGKKRSDAALGNPPQNTSSPDGATQESAKSLLKILLANREAGFRGRGKYRPPTAPDLGGLPDPPAGWIWASPEQLAHAAPYSLGIGPFGSNLKVSDYRESGTPLIFVRNIRAEDFNLVAKFVAKKKANELAAHTAEGGDILITKMGEPPGDAAFYPVGAPKAVITADCIKWRLAEDLRVPKFFVYAIRSRLVQQQIQNRTRGVAQKKISLERFRDLAIPLPPLPEQRRIVAEIEKQFTRLEAGVAALRRVQANLKRYRAAVLKSACEGRLVENEVRIKSAEGGSAETGEQLLERILTERRQNWLARRSLGVGGQGRGQYKEPTAPKTTDLPRLPEGWTWTTLDALAEIKGGIAKDQNRKHTAPARLVPYLRVANVQRGYIDLSEVKEIVTTEDDIRELALKSGDILFNEGGDRDKLGRGWVWNGELPECIHQNHVFRARLYVAGLNPKLVSWYANTFGQKFFFDQGKHTTNLASISMSKLKGLPVPIPPPAEQTRIVAEVERRLSVVEELESVVTANLQRASSLRQSILKKAFTGELV